jgi:hypothetical protein
MKRYIALHDDLAAIAKAEARGHVFSLEDLALLVKHGAFKCVCWLLPRYSHHMRGTLDRDVRDRHQANAFHLVAELWGWNDTPLVCISNAKAIVCGLVQAGIPLGDRNCERHLPIEVLWMRAKAGAEPQRTLSQLFIDYGSEPTGYYGSYNYRFDSYTEIDTLTMIDYVSRKETRQWLRHQLFPILFGVLRRRRGLPKELARMIVSDPVLTDPSAWRDWQTPQSKRSNKRITSFGTDG